MIEIKNWMKHFLQALDAHFGERAWFVGLQGSYGRGEATEASDIDIVVILNELTSRDIQTYKRMLEGLPNSELICGFLSGRKEILNWDAADLFQFYHDTLPIRGSLDELQLRIDDAAVNRAIKTGICSIYHGCVHNMLYDRSDEILKALYKSASFVVQAICFKQTGRYIRLQKDLLKAAELDEKSIVSTFLQLKSGGKVEFDEMSEVLFAWSGKWILEDKLN